MRICALFNFVKLVICLFVFMICPSLFFNSQLYPQSDFPGFLVSDFYRINECIDNYYKDYNYYPSNLKEAWDRPGRNGWIWSDLKDWDYSVARNKKIYSLKHKKYKLLRNVDTKERKSLLEALDSPNEFLREQVLEGLTDSEKDFPLIIKLLHSDQSPYIRSSTVFKIERIYPPEKGRQLLLEALLDPEDSVWECASRALMRKGGEDIFNILLDWSRSEDSQKRVQAARLICDAWLKDPNPKDIWELLNKLLDDYDMEVRISAAISIGNYREQPYPDEIKNKLMKGLSSDDKKFRQACARSLGEKGYPEAIPIIAQSLKEATTPKEITREFRYLGRIKSDEVVKILRSYMNHKDSKVRRSVIFWLVTQKYENLSKDLISLMYDSDPEVRAEAIRNASSITDYDVIPDLVKMLSNKDAQVRAEAAKVLGGYSACGHPWHIDPSRLGELKDSRAVLPLVERLKDSNEYVRVAAAMALCLYENPNSTEGLISALNDPTRVYNYNTVSAYAAYALHQMRVDVPTEKLFEAILISEFKSYNAIGYLAEDHSQKEELKRRLHEKIPYLLESKNERELVGALTALLIFPFKDVNDKVMELTKHPARMVRESATYALERIRVL